MAIKDEFADHNHALHDLLALLAPHTVRAAQLNRTLPMAQCAAEAFSGFLDAIVLPMLVVKNDCAGLLEDVFKLAPREAEVCKALLAAKSVTDIALERRAVCAHDPQPDCDDL